MASTGGRWPAAERVQDWLAGSMTAYTHVASMGRPSVVVTWFGREQAALQCVGDEPVPHQGQGVGYAGSRTGGQAGCRRGVGVVERGRTGGARKRQEPGNLRSCGRRDGQERGIPGHRLLRGGHRVLGLSHVQDVSAEALCAGFHKPLPRKRADQAARPPSQFCHASVSVDGSRSSK